MQLLPFVAIVLALNLAIVSNLCLAVALIATGCLRSLVKQHAVLVSGLVLTLLAPLVVAIAAQFPLAILPTIDITGTFTDPASHEDSAASAPSDSAQLTNQPIGQHGRPSARELPSGTPLETVVRSLPKESREVQSPLVPDVKATSNTSSGIASSAIASSETVNSRSTLDAVRSTTVWSRRLELTTDTVTRVQAFGSPLVIAWIIGFIIAILLRMRDWFRCQRLLEQCCPVALPMGLAAMQVAKRRTAVVKDIQVLACPGLPAPVVVGCLRPRLLLPGDFAERFTSQQLEIMLVHELTHIARKDHWTLVLAIATQTLHWWNPLAFAVGRRLSAVREMICDAAAISNAEEPRSYAALLIEMAERAMAGPTNFVPLGIIESSRSELTRRIERLLAGGKEVYEATLSKRFLMLLATCGGLLLTTAIAAQIPVSSRPGGMGDDTATQPVPNQQTTTIDGDQVAANADDDQEKTQRLTLRVVDSQGQPIPDAEIQISGTTFQDVWLVVGKVLERRNSTAVLQADERGVLTLNLPDGVSPAFAIRAPGFAKYWAEWGRNPIPDEHVVELEKARTIGGVLLDEQGQPIAGAKLRASIYFKMRPGDPSVLGTGNVVSSDETGTWTMDHVPVSMDNVSLEVSHPAYQPFSAQVSTKLFEQHESQVAAQSLVMLRGLTVEGRITDTAGAPIGGAVVRTKLQNTLRETTSQADGSYELDGCDARLVTITVTAPGKALTMRKVQIVDAMQPVDFTMQTGGHIRIRVVDRDNQPVPKTRMFFQKWNGERIGYFEFDHVNSYTDANGIWEWNEAPLEPLHVDICPPTSTSLSEQLIQAREEEYVFEALPLLRITGKVIDAETRQPIEKFQVLPGVRGSRERMNWVPSEAFEGTDGVFEYSNSHGYLAHLVKIQADGYAPMESREVASNEGMVKILFELKPAPGINMRVMTPDGQPAVGAKVALGVKGAQINITNGDIDAGSTYAETTTVNAAGRFKFPQQATPYQLIVVHESGFAHVESEKLTHPDLIPLTAWATVHGTFRSSGQAVEGVQLYLNSGSVHSYGQDRASIFTTAYLTTGKDGEFSFSRVFPGDGWIARSIVRVHNQGAQEVASSKSAYAKFIEGETTEVDFSGKGAVVRAQLSLAEANEDGPVLWAFVDVSLEPVQREVRQIPFPPAVENDPDQRSAWYREWRTSEDGEQWGREYAVAVEEQKKRPSYRATVAKDGTVTIADVAAGHYTVSAQFWDGSRSERFDELKLEISPQAATRSETIDLGKLMLQQPR